MYSRFPPERREKLRLPENYSGCAFSPEHPYPPPSAEFPKAPNTHTEHSGHAERTDEKTIQESNFEASQKTAPHEPNQQEGDLSPIVKKEKEIAKDPPFSIFGNHGLSIPLPLSFDELLLIGLILLLARSETDSDVILWLVLLLFCK